MKITIIENDSSLTGEEIATFASDHDLANGRHAFDCDCGLIMTGSFTIDVSDSHDSVDM